MIALPDLSPRPRRPTPAGAMASRSRAACVLIAVQLAYPRGGGVSAEPFSFSLTGSCSYNSDINDIFEPVNTTADNRWYYQGQAHGSYIYFDPGCDGSSGLVSAADAWLIDSDEPSTTATSDLDDDGECLGLGDGFKAQIFDFSAEPPVGHNIWKVRCGAGTVNTDLTIALIGVPAPTFPTQPRALSDQCPGTCYGQTCDHWLSNDPGLTCEILETTHLCDCASCVCDHTTQWILADQGQSCFSACEVIDGSCVAGGYENTASVVFHIFASLGVTCMVMDGYKGKYSSFHSPAVLIGEAWWEDGYYSSLDSGHCWWFNKAEEDCFVNVHSLVRMACQCISYPTPVPSPAPSTPAPSTSPSASPFPSLAPTVSAVSSVSAAPTIPCDVAQVLPPTWVDASESNLVGTLATTREDYELSFEMHITGGTVVESTSILQVGNEEGVRLPRVAFQPGSFDVHVSQSHEYLHPCS